MAVKVVVEYNVESCEECPYCSSEIGGYPVLPECRKTLKKIEDMEEIDVDCPFEERAESSVH
jgi:hypothetical protein